MAARYPAIDEKSMDVKKPRISDVDGRLRIGVFSTVAEL
jgi:hypothetical protein